MYCKIHHKNNCIECAIKKQTLATVDAINNIEQEPVKQKESMWPFAAAAIVIFPSLLFFLLKCAGAI